MEVCLNDSLSHIHGCFALLLILEGIIAQLECLFCLILTKIVKIKPMIAWIEVFVIVCLNDSLSHIHELLCIAIYFLRKL